jgi:hypothetical protein
MTTPQRALLRDGCYTNRNPLTPQYFADSGPAVMWITAPVAVVSEDRSYDRFGRR